MKYQPPFQFPPPVVPVVGTHNEDGNAGYVNGNPAAGIEGSIPPAESWEHPQREIVEVITNAGITPSHTDLTQLRQAIQKIARRDVSLVSEGTGVVVYNGKETTGDLRAKIRSLKAGTNVTITVDEDGSIRIAAAGGGGGGGGGTTISGEGVAIGGDSSANLNFPGLTGQSLLDDPDLFAFFNQAASGQTSGHRVITWAQLRAAISAAVAPVVQGSITLGSDVLAHAFDETNGGTQNLGAATPICQFPDVDLRRAAGAVHLHLAAWATSLPNGNIVFEVSFDGGSTYVTAATTNAAVTGGLGTSDGAGAVTTATFPRAATYSGGFAFALVPNSAGQAMVLWQPGGVTAPGSIRQVAPTSFVAKARARYTGTGTPLRVHGRRVISNVGQPIEYSGSEFVNPPGNGNL